MLCGLLAVVISRKGPVRGLSKEGWDVEAHTHRLGWQGGDCTWHEWTHSMRKPVANGSLEQGCHSRASLPRGALWSLESIHRKGNVGLRPEFECQVVHPELCQLHIPDTQSVL